MDLGGKQSGRHRLHLMASPRARFALFVASMLAISSCNSAPPSEHACNTPSAAGNDPLSVTSVRCEDVGGSDLTVDIEQQCPSSGLFHAHVLRTRPSAIDRSFTQVGASFSGDFFNFDQPCTPPSADCEDFHLLARPDSANVELDWRSATTPPALEVDTLDCTITR
jgi:hypothetical protein